jgi:hypothetical protein
VFDVVLAQRGATPLMWKQWQPIDAEELRRGAETGRLRVKFVDVAEMLATARCFALTPSLVWNEHHPILSARRPR